MTITDASSASSANSSTGIGKTSADAPSTAPALHEALGVLHSNLALTHAATGSGAAQGYSMSSRSIDDLHPLFQPKVREFLQGAKAAGLDVLLYCGYRSHEEQNELYAQGRTKPGKIVTNARAGASAHNYGLAFDAVPMVHGKPAWDDHEAWQIYGHVASAVGLEWAGTWHSFREMPHVQLPGWKQTAKVT